jgi:Mn2+/Fe2+ NRAMP family transporter
VAAAFVGPGTVTTATLAGAGFGVALLWALLFSTLATMALQEMAARLGLVTGAGLGEAIRRRFSRPLARTAAVGLVVAAIALGNAAYQTGNLLGGALGLQEALGGGVRLWVVAMGAVGAALLGSGRYRLVERAMVVLVAVMALAFVATAVLVLPSIGGEIIVGLLMPSLPEGSTLVALGLVGTTVVPYNLFLHASAVGRRWDGVADLGAARRDLILSIGIGGGVSMAILVTSAGTIFGTGIEIDSAGAMARQLEPALGGWARGFFAVGLFAAGMTSSVTAPLAAAWATAGALGWEDGLKTGRMRAIWGGVLGVGIVLALSGIRPVPAILFAQAMNGILLPAVAAFLLLVANDRGWMGSRANGIAANVVGGVVVLVTAVLGLRALVSVARSLPF